jgi:hypothetical protein
VIHLFAGVEYPWQGIFEGLERVWHIFSACLVVDNNFIRQIVSQIFLVIARSIFPIGKIILWSIPKAFPVGKFGKGGFHA